MESELSGRILHRGRSIPAEVEILIFSFCGFFDLFRCRGISRYWSETIRREVAIRRITFLTPEGAGNAQAVPTVEQSRNSPEVRLNPIFDLMRTPQSFFSMTINRYGLVDGRLMLGRPFWPPGKQHPLSPSSDFMNMLIAQPPVRQVSLRYRIAHVGQRSTTRMVLLGNTRDITVGDIVRAMAFATSDGNAISSVFLGIE